MKSMLFAFAGVLALAGCATTSDAPTAIARLEPTTGNAATGVINFKQTGDTVLISGEVRNLKPNSTVGFHIHEKGDCGSGDGVSAGGHFNPSGKPHAAPTVHDRHAGDMPALKANADGVATYSFTSDVITVSDGPMSIVGRGLIVHAGPDDYITQPTGNSGARIACAVISRN